MLIRNLNVLFYQSFFSHLKTNPKYSCCMCFIPRTQADVFRKQLQFNFLRNGQKADSGRKCLGIEGSKVSE